MSTIPLSTHAPLADDDKIELWPAQLEVGIDFDSSLSPHEWAFVSLTDADHDSYTIKLTMEEAAQLKAALDAIVEAPNA